MFPTFCSEGTPSATLDGATARSSKCAAHSSSPAPRGLAVDSPGVTAKIWGKWLITQKKHLVFIWKKLWKRLWNHGFNWNILRLMEIVEIYLRNHQGSLMTHGPKEYTSVIWAKLLSFTLKCAYGGVLKYLKWRIPKSPWGFTYIVKWSSVTWMLCGTAMTLGNLNFVNPKPPIHIKHY